MITLPDFEEEKALWGKGYNLVIGVDEVGRGCFAGPIVAGAVAFVAQQQHVLGVEPLKGINDSKQVKPQERKRLSGEIKKHCLAYGVGEIGVATINKVGIGKATTQAMRLAIKNLEFKIQNDYTKSFVLIDAFHVKFLRGIGLGNQKAIKKGDEKSVSIAAASIIAKVYRDKLMQQLSKQYMDYGWGRNKGYGTKFHQEAIKQNGITKLHRIMFVETFLRSQGLALRG